MDPLIKTSPVSRLSHGEHMVMLMARPPTAVPVAADGRAVRARQGGPSTFPFMSELPKWGVQLFRG